MGVEVQAVDGATDFLVLQDALGTIAERNDREAVAADGHSVSHVVHVLIAHSLRSNIASYPCIENAGTIDAKQDAEASLLWCIVNVGESVHS